MGRLSGRGTKGLSVALHGPHVDKTKFPDAAFVELNVFLTDLKKSVKIRRIVSTPKKVTIEPDEPEIRAVVEEIAEHPEITLSRRDILRFILVEPAKRSEEIQALLKLDTLGDARRALNAALNTLIRAEIVAQNHVKASRNAFLTHLQLSAIKTDDILEAINNKRALLNLKKLDELTKETNLADGLTSIAGSADFNKESALRDIKALLDGHDKSGDLARTEAEAIVRDLTVLDEEPMMLAALQRREFVEKGLAFVNNAECPLCDTTWPNIEHLKDHLRAKLEKSKEAKSLQDTLLANAGILAGKLIQFAALIQPTVRLAEIVGEKEFAEKLRSWSNDLEAFRSNLTSIEKVRRLKERFATGWLKTPVTFMEGLTRLNDKIKARPDQSATIDAQTFLTTAQLRLTDFRKVRKDNEAAGAAKSAAKVAYDTYCAVLEEELNALYDEVQQDFSAYYRALNGSDEAGFTAKLSPTAGSLGLDVNFYDRGLFPPGAYHSEGHQDGMGVCLYLALMKRLFGHKFTLSLMDDVVMSVDTGHRHEFCKLLKTEFPGTQFIITTHDKVWASQMKYARLVSGKTMANFYGWTIDTGPLVQSNAEIWEEINAALGKGRVDQAASALRHHLEYTMRELADELGARPQFRSDENYELDDMLSSVLTRMKRLWGDAAKSAESWSNTLAQATANEKKQFLSSWDDVMRKEQWAVNKAVNYNEWANFEKADFIPVVNAFKELLDCFRCGACDGWIYVLTKQDPQSLRCDCAGINFNLTTKKNS